MNNKLIYIPISFFVLFSIVLLSLEVPTFGLLKGFVPLVATAFSMSILLAIFLFFRYRIKFDGESLYALIGISLIFSFIFFLAMTSMFNRQYATNNCETASYKVLAYQGRYTSGYGNLEKGKVTANQWILKVVLDGEIKQFNLENDISDGKAVTRTMELEFCKGILGTKYLRLE